MTSKLNKKWWHECVFYELYMPSFLDANGDGVGDFRGIIQKLDYLAALGIKGIWLTPFYPSPKVDNGYDISDYCAIAPEYGTLEDFKEFMCAAAARDIKVVIDVVINHTSDQHPWFLAAKLSKNNPYRDYYIWRQKPNNWESFFSGSAWEYDPQTQEYYYHKFAKQQVDLNWRNPRVLEEIKRTLKFWLELGVKGIRFDVINFLSSHGVAEDNPVKENGEQDHRYDINQPGIFDVISEINQYVRSFGDIFTIGEVGSDDLELLKNYQSSELLDVVFNFNLGSIKEFDSQKIFDELKNMEAQLSGYPTLFFSSHDMARYINRLGDGTRDIPRAKALASLMLCLKGIPFIYFGDEIGMTDLSANSIDEIHDIQGRTNYATALSQGKSAEEALLIANRSNRDKSRSPMQWSNNCNAGFTHGQSWLKINDNFREINVAQQESEQDSLLHFYQYLIHLRNREPALMYGEYQTLSYQNGLITAVRIYEQHTITILVNLDSLQQIELAAGELLLGSSDIVMAKNEVKIISQRNL